MSDINSHRPKSYADLHRRIIGKADVVHSNIYAQEAHGDRIGSTSHETFNQRLDIHDSRQTVRSYRESGIGSRYGVLKSQSVGNRREVVAPASRPNLQRPPAVQRSFQEPTVRKYNPYS